jgi:hypothetical protein
MANQNFPRDDRGDKTLHKVTELIIVVSLPPEEITDKLEGIDLSVGVMSAQKKDKAMN